MIQNCREKEQLRNMNELLVSGEDENRGEEDSAEKRRERHFRERERKSRVLEES